MAKEEYKENVENICKRNKNQKDIKKTEKKKEKNIEDILPACQQENYEMLAKSQKNKGIEKSPIYKIVQLKIFFI